MKLKRWLAIKGVSQSELAEQLGTYPGQVCQWVQGKVRPSAKYISKIYNFTNHEVDPDDWETADD